MSENPDTLESYATNPERSQAGALAYMRAALKTARAGTKLALLLTGKYEGSKPDERRLRLILIRLQEIDLLTEELP